MEILNKKLAPFGKEVWATIESELANYLSKRLTLRGVVDFKDSYGFNTDAINTGNTKKVSSKNGTIIITREPLKMVEIKHTFSIPKALIEDLKRGFMVALDDVGSGYSSLNMIAKLVPDILKIDRAIIDHIDINQTNQSVFRAIVQLAKREQYYGIGRRD